MIKKFFCMLIAIIMCVGIIPVVSFAEDDNLSETLEFLQLVGIGNDYDVDTTQFDTEVTRAVYAEYITKLIGEDNLKCDTVYYHDVSRDYWAFDYIGHLTEKGLIRGNGDNYFYPDNVITKNEAVAILMSILKYNNIADNTEGFPEGYLNFAEKIGITKGCSRSGNVTLKDMLKLFQNTLRAHGIEEEQFIGNSVKYRENDDTLLNRIFNLYEESGKVIACEGINPNDISWTDDDTAIIDNTEYKYEMNNILEYLGENVNFVYSYDKSADSDKKIVWIKSDKSSKTLNIDVNSDASFDKTNYTLSYYNENDKKRTANVSKGVMVFYNGEFVGTNIENYLEKEKYSLTLFSTNDSNIFNVAVIWERDNYVVSGLNEFNCIVYDKINKSRMLDLSENKYDKIKVIDKNGEKVEFSELTESDIISVYLSESKKRIRAVVSHEKIEGVITSINNENGYNVLKIDEKSYKTKEKNNLFSAKSGDKVTVYFDYRGEIAYISVIDNSCFVAYIIDIKTDAAFGGTTLKLMNQNGEFLEAECDDKVTIDGATYSSANVYPLFRDGDTTKQQLIVCKVNSKSKIKSIDTVIVNSKYESADSSLSVGIPMTSECRYQSTGKLGYKILIDNNTIIFDVPSKYSNDTKDFSVKGKKDLGIDTLYDTETYRVNNKEIDYEEVILIKGAEWYDTRSTVADVLVEEINEKINTDGDIVEELVGYSGANRVEVETDGDYSLFAAGIKKGDIVHINKNYKGCIKSATIKYKYGDSERPKNTALTAAYRILKGYASNVIGSTLQIGYDSSSGFDEVFEMKNIPVLIVENDDDKIRVGTVSDIKPFSVYGDECSDVYFQTYGSAIKLVVSYQ